MTSPSCRRKDRAARLGEYSSSAAARRTDSARSSRTAIPLSTRETVAFDTPARAATSEIVVTTVHPSLSRLSPDLAKRHRRVGDERHAMDHISSCRPEAPTKAGRPHAGRRRHARTNVVSSRAGSPADESRFAGVARGGRPSQRRQQSRRGDSNPPTPCLQVIVDVFRCVSMLFVS